MKTSGNRLREARIAAGFPASGFDGTSPPIRACCPFGDLQRIRLDGRCGWQQGNRPYLGRRRVGHPDFRETAEARPGRLTLAQGPLAAPQAGHGAAFGPATPFPTKISPNARAGFAGRSGLFGLAARRAWGARGNTRQRVAGGRDKSGDRPGQMGTKSTWHGLCYAHARKYL